MDLAMVKYSYVSDQTYASLYGIEIHHAWQEGSPGTN
jgi:hypothetical protein